jgi:hypothetical protein
MLCRGICNAPVANFLLAKGFVTVQKVGIIGLYTADWTLVWLSNYIWEVMGLSSLQIPHPVISISLDPLSRTWLASNLQQMLTCSKLSPPD